jgi:hypothetical protein
MGIPAALTELAILLIAVAAFVGGVFLAVTLRKSKQPATQDCSAFFILLFDHPITR